MNRIIGIDLGTSTSEAAIILDGSPLLIPDTQGNGIQPSVTGLENGRIIVGEAAAQRQLLYPEDTVVEIKRRMGSGDRIRLGNKFYTPQELSSNILIHIKDYVQEYLKEPVERAVITVPAYFNNDQRKATMEAGKLAGFTVERILNEPTAAALCYGLDHIEEESRILVYDFGGGTFDVTLLEMFEGVLEVKASSGNNELGGKEFDQRLINYLITAGKEKYGLDLSKDMYAMVKLREAAICCKIALSSQDSYEIVLPMIGEVNGVPVTLQETVTVGAFEEMISDLVELTRKPIQVVLADSGYTSNDIDLILLVGGSTRIPYIGRYVEELLGKKPEKLVDPDLAVALGAAVQAGILNHDFDSEEGIMLTDVAPYPLGVRVLADMNGFLFDNHMDVIINRNTTIPVTKTKRYNTAVDNQKYADIEVYQGEKEIATENRKLGEFKIGEFPRGRAGKEKIDVKFTYDLNGILEVEAIIVSTGKAAFVTIDMKEVTALEDIDTDNWDKAPQSRKFRSTIRKAQKLLEVLEEESSERVELEELVIALKEALVLNRDMEELEDIESDILDLFEELE